MSRTSDLIRNSSFWSNLFKTPANKNDLENILQSIPLFDKLSYKQLKDITKLIHHRAYQPDEVIFMQDDPGIALYIILEGNVEIQMNFDQQTIKLTEFNECDFFGELALLENEIRSASAVSKTNTKLAVIFKPDFDEFIDKHPSEGVKILRGFTKILSVRLKELNNDYIGSMKN
ncbi:MAG: cyclic nucleotide-binding domain-containing protein [Melioribacteraceae bacterium]|nr:cyclic nucleotide-binding domain-containing protein [Melioribacteraceae bacterium]